MQRRAGCLGLHALACVPLLSLPMSASPELFRAGPTGLLGWGVALVPGPVWPGPPQGGFPGISRALFTAGSGVPGGLSTVHMPLGQIPERGSPPTNGEMVSETWSPVCVH